jgi:GNAT superfamily N-acetyltransferase
MNLLKATPSDLETILHHRREMFREMGHANDPDLFVRADDLARKFFGKAFRDGHYHGWLVEEGGRAVAGGGVILVEYHPSPTNPCDRRPWIVNMYTEPAARRQGFARLLMETMIAWCKAEGFAKLYLHASDAGRPLYEIIGFQPSNEMILKL